MCIFVDPDAVLEHVAATSIFARGEAAGRQTLVYSMNVSTSESVVMVLPLPIPPGAGEGALRFINLENYPEFFEDLSRAFPMAAVAFARGLEQSATLQQPQHLRVHEVGAFEASFVPSRADFGRLDPRFCLSDAVWAALPDYADWGFAVFQLAAPQPAERSWLDRLLRRDARASSNTKSIHPMAFSFSSRDPSRLFFPTVHVHDGEVHGEAEFDHALYAQPRAGQTIEASDWRAAELPLGDCVDAARARELLDVELPCFKSERVGLLVNADTYVSPSSS